MDTLISEQELRRVAVYRHLQGERPCDICRDLDRSPRWFYKWWQEYQSNPETDFSDHCSAPRILDTDEKQVTLFKTRSKLWANIVNSLQSLKPRWCYRLSVARRPPPGS